jgi:hypothetical protein
MALVGALLGAPSVSAACAHPEACRLAEAAVSELRSDFGKANMQDYYRLIDVRADGALLVAEFEVQADMKGLTSDELAELRAQREAARLHGLCEENVRTRKLIDAGVDIRVRNVSKNGVVLNDLIVTDCEAP